MADECSEWLSECMKVFPKLKKYVITAGYSRAPQKVLARVKVRITRFKDIDVEALLLRGESKTKVTRKLDECYQIEISNRLREIENVEVRKQVVQHSMIHELLHIERKDLETLDKNHRRRRQKKIHVKEFEEEVFQRYNQLRELSGLPAIQKRKTST